MKQKTTISQYPIILFSTIFCILLTFCSCGQTGQTSDASSNIVSKASNDKTIETPGTVVYTGKPTDGFLTDADGMALWAYTYSGPQDLSVDSSLIILGEVQSSECFVWSDPENSHSFPAVNTKNDILIKKVLKGNASVGDIITVCTDGGFIYYEEYCEYILSPFYEEAEEAIILDPEQKGILKKVDGISNSIPFLQEHIGEEFVLFLENGNLFEGSYSLVGDFMGRYYKNEEGRFCRYSSPPSASCGIDMDLKPHINEKSLNRSSSFSLEEIESLIE